MKESRIAPGGGIFGTEEDGIFDGKVLRTETPDTAPEERRVTITCDASGCRTCEVIILGPTTDTSTEPGKFQWTIVGARYYCHLHQANAVDDLEQEQAQVPEALIPTEPSPVESPAEIEAQIRWALHVKIWTVIAIAAIAYMIYTLVR